jgi:glycosyltransferase involved in cell wall biosynthesis
MTNTDSEGRHAPLRLGIVVPRYGLDVLGGAETFARHFAEHLPASEFAVTVLTTCARDLFTWYNEYAPSKTEVGNVPVLRFPIDHRRRDARHFQHLTARINRGEPVSVEDQAAWLEHSAHSPELYLHLAQHGSDYDLFLFLPYLFGTTIYGSTVWPTKSVICPCLHDEPYAAFEDIGGMLRAVRGLMFISAPEQALAEEKLGIRHPHAQLIGFGLDEYPARSARFRQKFGILGPFILYAGRLDPMKNISQLVSNFLAYRQTRPDQDLKLVLSGSGPFTLPRHPDLIPLGFLELGDLHDAYAAATFLCQPSLVESFSIVLMESWLASTPVLVHGQCAVTRHHVLQCGGGLYFSTGAEFVAAVDWLLSHPDQRHQMGEQGQAYVRRKYSWPAVIDRFKAATSLWTQGQPG